MFPTDSDFGTMVQTMESGVLIHAAETKSILWANAAACQMFGFELDELRPLKAHHMSSPERQYRRAIGVAWLQEAVDTGSSRRRWKYRAKDGREFLTDALAQRVRLSDRDVVMVSFRNLTEDELRQDQLERAAYYLQRIMESSSAGISLLDENNRFQDVSELGAEQLGCTVGELLGRRLDEIGKLTPALESSVDRLAQTGVPVEFTLEVDDVGQTRWLSVDVETIAHDGIESRIATVRDITERMELNQQNERQRDRLHYLSRYNAMGDMAMTIAHELGQPLAAARNSLVGISSRIRSGTLSDADLDYGLDLASRQLSRATQIVSSVRRYVARIESSVALEDFSDIVQEALYFAGLRASENHVEIQTDFHDGPLPVRAENILIGQVILNLCFNAIDEVSAARRLDPTVPPTICVRTRCDEEWVTCEVIDEGRGMSLVDG